ncbi:MAG: aspartate--tRNA(Asn) ligase [Mycoplasmatota bacterium]
MIGNLKNNIGKNVVVSGHVDIIRDTKWVLFVVLRDSTGKIQLTIEKSEEKNKYIMEQLSGLAFESTLRVEGLLCNNEKVKLGGIEIIPSKIDITSRSEEVLPINVHDKDAQLIDQRIKYRWLDLRNDSNNLIFKIQSDFVKFFREYLYSLDFMEIHTPKLIGTASESGSEVFEVNYFSKKAFLAQSPQFYKQMAIASGYEKVFEVGPVFRAEKSYTNRHTTEFSGFDVEFANIESYEYVMDLEEEMIKYSLTKLNEKYKDLILQHFGIEINIPKEKIPRIKLSDLYNILEEKYGYVVSDLEKGDLTREGEKLSYKLAKEVYNSEFIFITDYNKENRAFYHMRKENVPQGYDLIWKGTEITTGAQREHRYDILEKQAKEKGLDKDVSAYLEFFKYGCNPHGGFGLGIDRLIMLLLDLPSLKESMFVYRGPNNLNP